MLQTDKAGEMPLSGLGSFISYEVRASTTRVLSLTPGRLNTANVKLRNVTDAVMDYRSSRTERWPPEWRDALLRVNSHRQRQQLQINSDRVRSSIPLRKTSL